MFKGLIIHKCSLVLVLNSHFLFSEPLLFLLVLHFSYLGKASHVAILINTLHSYSAISSSLVLIYHSINLVLLFLLAVVLSNSINGYACYHAIIIIIVKVIDIIIKVIVKVIVIEFTVKVIDQD